MSPYRYVLFASLVASRLASQGNVSAQGYGYPQGQLSARSLSMGGSIGEIDASSALNPAAIGRLTTRTVLFQLEPEYRSLKSGSITERTTTARYPLVNIGVPFGQRWVIGVSAASFLDRTWQTSSKRTLNIGGDNIETTSEDASDGAINDLRVASAWTNREWLYIGVGVHAFTGRNVLSTTEQFDDSAFLSSQSTQVLSYTGSALSAGVQMLSSNLNTVFGFSFRMGNALKASINDTTLTRGDVPNRFGASVAFTGLRGTILAARVARDQWSSMTPMLANAPTGDKANDSWEIGGGAEVTGPRVLGQTLLIRTGGRSRTLPFSANGKTVKETTASFGTGASFGGGRMSADLSVLRQWRNADLPTVKERAWTLSLSLTARP